MFFAKEPIWGFLGTHPLIFQERSKKYLLVRWKLVNPLSIPFFYFGTLHSLTGLLSLCCFWQVYFPQDPSQGQALCSRLHP